jgi:DNA-binding NtrC family response regulator
MTSALSLVLLSPHREDHEAMHRILDRSRWKIQSAWKVSDALKILRGKRAVSVVVCERQLEDGDWKSVFGELEGLKVRPIMIVCDRVADEHLWAEALNYGVFDVLSSAPFEADEVVRMMESVRLARSRMQGRGPLDAAASG